MYEVKDLGLRQGIQGGGEGGREGAACGGQEVWWVGVRPDRWGGAEWSGVDQGGSGQWAAEPMNE